VCCHLCGRWMKAVGGTHLRWHGWTIDDYREAFQLGRQTPTCARGVSDSLRRAAERHIGHNGFGKPPPRPAVTRTPPPWRSLAGVRPELVAELHPTANASLDASEVAAASRRKLWWRCSRCGHEWESSVGNRVALDSGCPRCAIERRAGVRARVPKERSLAVTRPELAAQLHPTRNHDLDPYTLGPLRCRRSGGGVRAAATIGGRRSPTAPEAPAAPAAGADNSAGSGATFRWLGL
jgi:hypothetical protein